MTDAAIPRYAVYFVPEAETALYRFGAAVLGYDCYSGNAVPTPFGTGPRWERWVQAPRVYGFHATLKAPFRLAEGVHEDALYGALDRFAADRPAVPVGDLAIREIGSFIALVPSGPQPLLDRLAQDAVADFDKFRAPLTEAERSRRFAGRLTARQIANLDKWGYPHVFEDFRFHMTLTGALAQPERSMALDILCQKFDQLPEAGALTLRQVVVSRQAGPESPFRVVRAAALGG